jgi:hypothetical protein
MDANCREDPPNSVIYWQVIHMLAPRAMGIQMLLSWVDRRRYRLIITTLRTGPSTTP